MWDGYVGFLKGQAASRGQQLPNRAHIQPHLAAGALAGRFGRLHRGADDLLAGKAGALELVVIGAKGVACMSVLHF